MEEGGTINAAREVLIFISGWTLDAVLVYRVYILFGRSLLVAAIPGLCLVGTMGMFRRLSWCMPPWLITRQSRARP
jgi:hypothetical protein